MTTPTSASRLLALPAEIRNDIWELSFSGTDREVDLLTCHAPSLELLLASHQVCEEAKGFWPDKRREYFSTTNFTITSPSTVPQASASLSDDDIATIRHIKLLISVRDIPTMGSPRNHPELDEVLNMVIQSQPNCILSCVRLRGYDRSWQVENAWSTWLMQNLFVTLRVRNGDITGRAWRYRVFTMSGGAFTPITREELSVLLGRDI
ncbi:hypothetical protein LTS10_009034 [Elasticomyces elasticus]|nr:hypothetical protein LTS10_009034 [Elasticomyces elasticus]